MRVLLGSQVVVTFRKSAQPSVVSVGPRLPRHPATHPPAKGSASSDKSKRPSLWLPPQGLPVLFCPSYPNNPLFPTSLTVRVFGTSRRFPALAFGPRHRLCSIKASALSGDSARSLLPPRKTSVPSATASGRPHSRRRLRLFPSVLRLLPAPGTEKGGRMKTRWVKGRDTKKGRGPGSRHLPPRVGRVEEKKSRSRGKPRKAARDQSSQRVEGARSRCGGWQRSSMRLRRIEAEGAEMYFCACVEVGVSRGFSPLGEDRFQSLQRACAIVSLPLGKARRSRPLRLSLPGWRSNRVSAPAPRRRTGAAESGPHVAASRRGEPCRRGPVRTPLAASAGGH